MTIKTPKEGPITQRIEVKTPFTKEEVAEICIKLDKGIDFFLDTARNANSAFSRQTFEDVADVLIDIKSDLDAWGKTHALPVDRDSV